MAFFVFPFFNFHIPHIPDIPHIPHIPDIPDIPHIPEIFDLGIFPVKPVFFWVVVSAHFFWVVVSAHNGPIPPSPILLSPLSSFYVCRHIQRAIHKLKFIAFFKMNVSCKKQLAMQVPAKRNVGCSIGFECLISHWLTRRGGRTYVRSDISDVITLPKFFACMHFLYSLTHGASLARYARGGPLIIAKLFCNSHKLHSQMRQQIIISQPIYHSLQNIFITSKHPVVHLSSRPHAHTSTCPHVHMSTGTQVHRSTGPQVHRSTCPRSTGHMSTRTQVHKSTGPRQLSEYGKTWPGALLWSVLWVLTTVLRNKTKRAKN